jgi:glutamine amidotransferase-like uncharacterized protein
MKPTIALFLHHPECSIDCCDGMIKALSKYYTIKTFSEHECNHWTLGSANIVAFPGGIGDANSYDKFFRRKAQNDIADYVTYGGRYLGICMGAYWAGSHYFDILNGVDAVQYIKRPTSDIKRSYSTVANIKWDNTTENMFFYDGCAFVGDTKKFTTIASYANGDAMAIIQNRVGVIGCHPESQEYWYDTPRQYLKNHWHNGKHHTLLLDFVNQLMK